MNNVEDKLLNYMQLVDETKHVHKIKKGVDRALYKRQRQIEKSRFELRECLKDLTKILEEV